MHGFDWYDYGARFYDPEICQWHAIDPSCEKYYDVSPYAYCVDEPVRLIDTGGEKIIDSNGNIAVYYDSERNYHYTKYATNDIIRIVNSLKMTQQGRTQLGKMINSSINVKMEISPNVFRINNGYRLGAAIQGNSNSKDNYGETYKNGIYGIKESTMILYQGSIEEAIKKWNL